MTGANVRASRVVITNDQILTLPTTTVELVPAQGPNKLILPINILVVTHFPIAYTDDLTDGDALVFAIGTPDSFTEFAAIPNASDVTAGLSFLLTTTTDSLFIPPAPDSCKFSTDWGGLLYNGISGVIDYNNLPFFLTAFAHANFTGGDKNNHMTVTVVYVVVDL